MERRFPNTPQAGLGTVGFCNFTGDFNTGCPNLTVLIHTFQGLYPRNLD